MTPEQRNHVMTLSSVWVDLMTTKYDKGAKEHGGNIWENSIEFLLKEALLENIDQFVYLYTALQNYRKENVNKTIQSNRQEFRREERENGSVLYTKQECHEEPPKYLERELSSRPSDRDSDSLDGLEGVGCPR